MPESDNEVTPQEIQAALAALQDDSPTQFTVNVMRQNGGQLPNITKSEINGLLPND